MANLQVSILMGSDSDLPQLEGGINILKEFGVAHDVRVISAHRTPDRLASYIQEAEKRGVQIFIGAAGGAAHLPGVIASQTNRPVLGIPIQSSTLDGLDSLLSIAQMPGGIPVGSLGVGKAGAKNAALLACQILALHDKSLAGKLVAYRKSQADAVAAKDDALQKKLK